MSKSIPQNKTTFSSQIFPRGNTYSQFLDQLPVPEASEADLERSARKKLTTINESIAYYCRGLLEHGSGKLERFVRFLCTDLWPTLYQLLTLQEQDGLRVRNISVSQETQLSSSW
jgi:hypothetical protein